MRLRKKTILSICVVLVGLIFIFELVLSNILLGRFSKLEFESVQKDIARAQKALLSEVRQLTIKAHDWSSWDDSYQFVQDLNDDYVQSNLQGSTLENMRIEDVQFYSTKGKFVFGLQYGLHGKSHDAGIHAEFVQAFSARQQLQRFTESDGEEFRFHEGFFRLPSGIVMFTSQPILPSDGSGEPRGTLVFVKLVNVDLIKKVADQVELSLDLVRLDGLETEVTPRTPPSFERGVVSAQRILDEDSILGFGLIKDIDHSPSFVLLIDEERSIFNQGIVTLRALFIALVALSIMVCLLIAFLLERLVISRLQQLCEQISRIATTGDSGARVSIAGKDELVIVSRAINTMLEALSRSEHNLWLAKEAAEAATRARAQFVANISHELRTPINGVLGMAQVLGRLPLGNNERQYVDMIRKASISLLGIVNDVLDFSKIEAGKFDLEEIDFHLRETLYECLQSIASRAQEKSLELIANVFPEVPDYLVGDPLRLRQVVINLCGNAIKFTDKGEVEVIVRIEDFTEEGLTLHFVVRDTGIGIPREKLGRVFEAFTQADGSTARKYGGTGLGLTISKDIVELMGGHIWAESQVGVGTEFHFLADLPVSPNTPLHPPLRVDKQAFVVVDDCQSFSRMLARDIEYRGGQCSCFSDTTKIDAETLPKPSYFIVDAEVELSTLEDFISRTKAAGHRVVLTCSVVRADILRLAEEKWQVLTVLKPVCVEDLLRRFYKQEYFHKGAQAEKGNEVRPLQILVVDDVALNRDVLRLMLEPHGHKVLQASSGREVLKLLEGTDVDIILLDSQMPEMDGPETAEAIRSREEASGSGKHLPIVAVTANALEGDRERLLASGMDDYLSKPVFADQLQGVLAKYCHQFAPSHGSTSLVSQEGLVLRVIDIDALTQRLGGKAHLAAEMLELFCEERDELFDNLIQAVGAENLELIRRSAHAFKGSLANINAMVAWKTAGEIEEMARDKLVAGYSGKLEQLREEIAELGLEMKRLLSSLEDDAAAMPG